LLKLRFLSDPAPPVTLIETFKWTPDQGYALFDRHLDRLVTSAAYFALPVTREAAADVLTDRARGWTGPMRVRLMLAVTGLDVSATPLPPVPEKFRFALSPTPLDSRSVWLAHKTTNRDFYDLPRKKAHDERGIDEV